MANSPLTWLQYVGDPTADRLAEAGFDSAEAVQDASFETLCGIESIGPARAKQLQDASIIPPDPARTTYQFEIDRETWDEWTGTIDDDIPIHVELRSLIRRERMTNTDTGGDTAKIAAIRARQCTMRALQSVASDNQTARDELSEIMRLMDRILG